MARILPDGRITIDGNLMKIRTADLRLDSEVNGEEELAKAAKEHFGITFD